MSPHQTIAVAIRLFAVWLAIYAGRTAPSFYRELVRMNDSAGSAIVIGISLLIVIFILYLWFFPKTVARGLLDSNSAAPVEAASPDTWFAVGCALLGLWLIVPALANLIYDLFTLYWAQRNPGVDTSDLRPAWIYYLAEIGFGIWLLLGARGARRIFWWARNREK